jgi:hypothetical protein
MKKNRTLFSVSLLVLALMYLFQSTMLRAGEPTGYVYQQGSILDSKTGKGVPGVPLALKAQIRETTYWSTGNTTFVDRVVSENKITDINGNYKSNGYAVWSEWWKEDPNGVPVKVVATWYGFLTPVVQTTDLQTVSSAGYTVYVRPKNIYNNKIDIPLTFVNTELSYGYNNLNKFLHNVASGSYTLVCAQPSVTLTAGSPGSVQFTFTMTGKYNNVSIGSATATISVAATAKEINGGLALAIDWSLSNLSLTGFNNNTTHISNVKNIINAQLEHTIYLAPAAFSGTAIAVDPPVGVTIWNETSLSSVAITSSTISLNIETGWYVAKAIGVISGSDGSGGGGGGGGIYVDPE